MGPKLNTIITMIKATITKTRESRKEWSKGLLKPFKELRLKNPNLSGGRSSPIP